MGLRESENIGGLGATIRAPLLCEGQYRSAWGVELAVRLGLVGCLVWGRFSLGWGGA